MEEESRLKILQIVCEMTQKQGGPTFSSLNLAEYLAEFDHKLVIIGNLDTNIQKKLMDCRVDFDVIESTLGNRSGLCLGGFSRLFKEITNHDQIIIHGFYTFTTLIVCFLARGRHIYIMPHGSLEQYQWGNARIKKFIFDLLFRLRDKSNHISFAVATEQEVVSVKKKFDNRIAIVGIGIDIPEEELIKENIRSECLNLFSVSRIAEKKRIDLSIQAVSILKKMNIEAYLWVYGEGERKLKEKLTKLSSELGVSESVHFAGPVPHESIESIYKTRGIYLLPSENENFAISVAESIAFQTPVVISSQVALSSFVEKYSCGDVIFKLDSSELANAVLNVHSNYNVYEKACLQNRHKLSHQNVKEAWLSLLKCDQVND